MPPTRRRYNNGTAAQIIKKIATPTPCESCMNLKYTPAFAESLMTVHKLKPTEVTHWYHAREHSIFLK